MKSLFKISILALLFCVACTNSNQKKAENVSKTETPKVNIQAAILSNNKEAVKQHIDAGTDLNVKDAMSGSTPLITAASFGREEIVGLLLNAKVELSKTNNDGATALHTATFFCRTNIVKMLLEANADKTAKNNYGQTPRETIIGPFELVKPIYEMLKLQLEPMGMEVDLERIEKTRPLVAEILK